MIIKTKIISETKEIKDNDIKVFETTTTIYVEPIEVKTIYCIKDKNL